MEAPESRNKFQSFLSRPFKDFVLISAILFFSSLITLSSDNSIPLRVGALILGVVLIGLILFKRFRGWVLDGLVFLALTVVASFSASAIFGSTGLEVSHVLLPGVYFMYFATLVILTKKDRKKLRRTILLLNGLFYLFVMSLYIISRNTISTPLFLLIGGFVLLLEEMFIPKEGSKDDW